MPKRSKNKKDLQAVERQRFYQFRDACHTDRVTAAKLLSEDSSLLGIRSGLGETALHFLVVENDLDAVQWLLSRGSDANTRNDFDATPLLEATQLGYVDLCRLLLENGADVNARDQYDATPISAAVHSAGKSPRSQERTLSLIQLLLERLGKDDDINRHFTPRSAEKALATESSVATFLIAQGLNTKGSL